MKESEPKHHSFKITRAGVEPYNMSYMEWGDSNNPNMLFCVHALTRNSRDFDYLAWEMCKDYRVIAVDIVGRGKSDWLQDKTQYNYGNYVQDVLALIQHLKPQRLDYIGTSMGGLIGIMLGAFQPHLVHKMVINDVGPFIKAEPLKRIAKYVGQQAFFDDIQAAELYLRKRLAPFGIRNDADWRYLTKHSILKDSSGKFTLNYDVGIAAIFGADTQSETAPDFDMWEVWQKLEVKKMLILRGTESDILSAETAERMQKTKDNVTMVEFVDVGHAPALMEPAQVIAVADWLRAD